MAISHKLPRPLCRSQTEQLRLYIPFLQFAYHTRHTPKSRSESERLPHLRPELVARGELPQRRTQAIRVVELHLDGQRQSIGDGVGRARGGLTVLPHHALMFVAPMLPLRGYCRQKKMRTMPIAYPASRPADSTSGATHREEAHISTSAPQHCSTDGRTVVLRPPAEVAAADDEVEDEPDEDPRDVVERRRGRDEAGPGEDDGEVEVLEDAPLELPVQHPLDERREEAHDEEEQQAVVLLALRELARGANDAPLVSATHTHTASALCLCANTGGAGLR